MGKILTPQEGHTFWKNFARWLAWKSVGQTDPSIPDYPLWYYVKMWSTPTRGSLWIEVEDMLLICSGWYDGVDIDIFDGDAQTTIKLRSEVFVRADERILLRRLAKRINAGNPSMIKEG